MQFETGSPLKQYALAAYSANARQRSLGGLQGIDIVEAFSSPALSLR